MSKFSAQDNTERLELYCHLMEEIKGRCTAIETALKKEFIDSLPGPNAGEFVILQFRFICELIAISCLTAHGDAPTIQNSRLKKEWKAPEIINSLARLHIDFYPIPVIPKIDYRSRKITISRRISPHLTRELLVKLWRRSGDDLHAKTLDRQNSRSPAKITADSLREILNMVYSLLEWHIIRCIDQNKQYYVTLRDPKSSKVIVMIQEREPPAGL